MLFFYFPAKTGIPHIAGKTGVATAVKSLEISQQLIGEQRAGNIGENGAKSVAQDYG